MKMIFIAVVLLCAFPSLAYASMEASVHVDDLLEGVSINEQIRFRIDDILVGTESVRHLFKTINHEEPSWWQYYTFKKATFRITLRSRGDVVRLLRALDSQHSDRLRVILRDHSNRIWRGLPGLRSDDLYTRVQEIVILQTPCDELTRIVYTRINSFLKERMELAGKTKQPVNINEVFEKLLHEQIEPYINSLDPVSKDDRCFKTFQLLRWLRGEEVTGFDLGEYRLHEGLLRALEPAVVSLHDLKSGWSQHQLTVRVVGHTDAVVVRTQKDFRLEHTGIDAWNSIQDPFNVRYSGCHGDRLTERKPAYVELNSFSGEKIEYISDNCKLGAVRAYVATVYLRNELGDQAVRYSYATGGIFANGDKHRVRPDATRRRVDIELTIQAAKSESPR